MPSSFTSSSSSSSAAASSSAAESAAASAASPRPPPLLDPLASRVVGSVGAWGLEKGCSYTPCRYAEGWPFVAPRTPSRSWDMWRFNGFASNFSKGRFGD